LPASHQHPNGDSGSNHAWLTARNTREAFDARKGFTQITHHPLEQLSLFCPRHLRKKLFGLLQSIHHSSFDPEKVYDKLTGKSIRLATTSGQKSPPK
jgi:hypothetical protein